MQKITENNISRPNKPKLSKGSNEIVLEIMYDPPTEAERQALRSFLDWLAAETIAGYRALNNPPTEKHESPPVLNQKQDGQGNS